MTDDSDDSSSSNNPKHSTDTEAPREGTGLREWVRNLVGGKSESNARETLEEYIEEYIEDDTEDEDSPSVSAQEKMLLANILELRDLKTADVMIPRADIVAIDIDTSQKELLALLAEKQFSRIPVYRETMDHILGTIHIKDVLASLARGETVDIDSITREISIVSPAMPVLDLLLQFRESKKHMVLVVDEYGGIDGLVTINDIIESIVGEIDDEHDQDIQAEMKENEDGSVIADARVDIEDFEDRFGKLLSEEERDESETLGGLVFFMAGRVPARGEVLTHDNGMVFEILDASPRRINRVCIRNIPTVIG